MDVLVSSFLSPSAQIDALVFAALNTAVENTLHMVLHVSPRVEVGGCQNGIVGCKPALAGIKRIIPLFRGHPLLTRVSPERVSSVDACVGVPR